MSSKTIKTKKKSCLKICVITSSRADYFPSRKLLFNLEDDSTFELQLVVTGSHLSSEFGLTYRDIAKDGFNITEKVEINLSSDSPVGISKTMGLSLIAFGEVYGRLKPDIVLVVGDRYEIFTAVAAAHISRIPIAHISGGEVTEGAVDEAFRHAISKMSYFHFTSLDEYRNRVIQLCENPSRVFCVGEIGLEGIENFDLLPQSKLETDLKFKFSKNNLLITFHPVTLENNTSLTQFKALLSALEKQKNTHLIFTKTNADTNGMVINKMIDSYVTSHPKQSISFQSLGNKRYWSLLQFVDAVIGNSSSGIWEVPSFKIGTINIGDRQKGRVRAESIIDCEPTAKSITKGLNKLYSETFQKALLNVKNPYQKSNTSLKIIDIIKKEIPNVALKKEFYDIPIYGK